MTPTQLTGSGPWNLSTLLITGPNIAAPGQGYYDKATLLWHAYTPDEIARLNAPPPAPFPEYVIAPTPAMWQGSVDSNGVPRAGTQSPVDPRNLSTLVDAELLAFAWGLGAAAISDVSAPNSFTANGETRRLFAITYINGVTYYVGDRIASSKLSNPAGEMFTAPGKWMFPAGQAPTFVADPQPAAAPLPPPPMIQLPAGFHLQGQMMGDPMIVRDTPVNAQGTGTAAGGLTADQQARLSNIERLLIAIGSRFGVS